MRTITLQWMGRIALLPLGLAVAMVSGCVVDEPTRLMRQGWEQLQAGQSDQALATAGRVLGEHPGSSRAAEALYLRGRAYEARASSSTADQAGNLKAANAAYVEALKQNPQPPLAGRIYSGLANTYYWLDDYSSAWRNWTTAYDLANDAETKSFTLYRIGLCQQRLGRFADADKTFLAVQQQYPGSDAANRAKAKVGARSFAVQVATFASAQSAEAAMNNIRREGFVPARQPNAQGQSVVTVAPFANYQQAKIAKDRLAGMFPDALIVP